MLGLMGTGKTSVGTALAAMLGWTFRDSDAEILASTGKTARDIAAEGGSEAIHREEARHLLGALEAGEQSVIGAAASVIENPACRDSLNERALVVWLKASVDTLVARFEVGGHRPLYGDSVEAMFRRQMIARDRLFEATADATIDVDAGTNGTTPTPPQLALLIVERLGLQLRGSDNAAT